MQVPPYREEYVREALAWGWYCPECKVWNGDCKVFLLECRCCGHKRPRVEHVVRGTRGKRMAEIDQFGRVVNRGNCGKCRLPLPCPCVGNPPNLMRRNSDSFVLPPVNWDDRRPLFERALEFRRSTQARVNRKRSCSVCGRSGHNRQTCPQEKFRAF